MVSGVIAEPDNLLDATSTTAIGQEIIDRLFLSLTEVGEDLLTQDPQLARRWETSEDGRTVTFHLDPAARWHDGVPVTAADVVFTHELLVDPRVGYSARSWKEFITGVEALDDSTVVYRFSRRYPYQIMDASVGVVLPQHLLGEVAPEDLVSCDFARHPVGNGPFRFSRWDPQQQIVLVANEDFSPARPFLDRVVFRIIPDKTTLLAELESGAIDVMDDVPPHEVERLRSSVADVRVEQYLGRAYTYIGWNLNNPLFASVDVRRALGMAIDRAGIIEALCYGCARPCLGPVHPILWAYDADLEPLPYDPAAARAILADAGWSDRDGDGVLDRDGVPFTFSLKTNLGNQLRMDAAVMIQSQLAAVGIAARPETYEWTVLWDSVIRHEYGDAVLVGWNVGLKVDMKPTFHSASVTEKYNHVEYRNPAVDSLIDAALSSETFAEAAPLWKEAQERVVADQPYTFLFIPDSVFGVNERVRGTRPDARGYYRSLDQWWIPESRQRRRGA